MKSPTQADGGKANDCELAQERFLMAVCASGWLWRPNLLPDMHILHIDARNLHWKRSLWVDTTGT